MQVIVEVGDYTCSKVMGVSAPFNNESICALRDAFGAQSMPPVNITIDYGDGSGEQVRMYLTGVPGENCKGWGKNNSVEQSSMATDLDGCKVSWSRWTPHSHEQLKMFMIIEGG